MRNVLNWAITRPRNARLTAGALAALVAAVVAANLVGTDPAARPAAPAATTTAAPSAPPTTGTAPRTGPTPGQDQEKDPDPVRTTAAVATVTRAFVVAWLAGPHVTKVRWLTGMAQTADPSLVPYLSTASNQLVPDATITEVLVTDADTYSARSVVTLTDTSRVVLGLTNGPDGWRVATLLPDDLGNP